MSTVAAAPTPRKEKHLGFYTVVENGQRRRIYVPADTSVADLRAMAKTHLEHRLAEHRRRSLEAGGGGDLEPRSIEIFTYTVTSVGGTTTTALTIGSLALAIGTAAIAGVIASLFYAFSKGNKVDVTVPQFGQGGPKRSAEEWAESAVGSARRGGFAGRQILVEGITFETDCVNGDCTDIANDNHGTDDDIGHQVYDLATSGNDDGSGHHIKDDGQDQFHVDWNTSGGTAEAAINANTFD